MLDIHGGGLDLKFPHHENEIAQSECANGTCFSRYWMHNGYINIDNRKMSKSLGNFFTAREIGEAYGYEPIRYIMVSSHYRSPVNYSTEIIEQAKADAQANIEVANAEAEAIRLKSIEVARALGFTIAETTVTDEDGVESVRYEIDFTGKTEREVELITEYLKYADYLAKWDGKLPSVMTGDSATIMIPTP